MSGMTRRPEWSIYDGEMFDRAMTRRSALSSAVFGFPLFAGAGPLTGRIKIAVKYQMILEPEMTVMEKFRMLREVGIDGTEVRTNEPVDISELERAIGDTGIPVHGIINASEPELLPALKLAKQLGCDSVLTWAKEDPKLSYDDNFKAWQGHVAKAVSVAEDFGIYLCVENVRATFLKTGEQMSEFIDSFDSPLVKSYFDLGNTITWTDQSAQDWATALGKRIYKLDIKDRGHSEFGEPKLRREGVVGTNGGEVHWDKVRAILDGLDFSGWATAEVRGGDRQRLERMAVWMREVLDL